MRENPIISVIIPVYKVEKYIRQCIESVITQSYTNWEAILIDDGSPDICGEICDEYAKSDSRISVIHQSNAGLSAARNAGMDKAVGKYVYFLDSDDYLSSKNSFEKLIHIAEQSGWPEYVKGSHEVLMPSGENVITRYTRSRQLFENKVLDTSEFLTKIILIHPLVWNGLISREFLNANRVRFEKNGWPREDLIFHIDLIGKKFRGVFTSATTYTYRASLSGSLSNTFSIRSCENIPTILTFINNSIDNCTDSEILKRLKDEQSVMVEVIFRTLPKLSKSDRNRMFKSMTQSLPARDFTPYDKYSKIMYAIWKQSQIISKCAIGIISVFIPKSKKIL